MADEKAVKEQRVSRTPRSDVSLVTYAIGQVAPLVIGTGVFSSTLDVFVPHLNLAVEFHGKQHYFPTYLFALFAD